MNRYTHAQPSHGFSRLAAHIFSIISLTTANRLFIRQSLLHDPRIPCILFTSLQRSHANTRSFSTIHCLSKSKTSKMVGANGVATRAKRKSHPTGPERPQKQLRALNGKDSTGVNTPEIDLMSDDDFDLDGPQLLSNLAADTAEWQAAIEQVVRNVVSIRFCQTCSFDTDPALTSEATGFVVDAERGFVVLLQLQAHLNPITKWICLLLLNTANIFVDIS